MSREETYELLVLYVVHTNEVAESRSLDVRRRSSDHRRSVLHSHSPLGERLVVIVTLASITRTRHPEYTARE